MGKKLPRLAFSEDPELFQKELVYFGIVFYVFADGIVDDYEEGVLNKFLNKYIWDNKKFTQFGIDILNVVNFLQYDSPEEYLNYFLGTLNKLSIRCKSEDLEKLKYIMNTISIVDSQKGHVDEMEKFLVSSVENIVCDRYSEVSQPLTEKHVSDILQTKKPVSNKAQIVAELEKRASINVPLSDKEKSVFEYTCSEDKLFAIQEEDVLHSAYEQGFDDEVEIAKYEKHQIAVLQKQIDWWKRQSTINSPFLSTISLKDLPEKTIHCGYVEALPADEDSEIIVIGDLHGCYNNLQAILAQSHIVEKIEAGEDAYLIFVGDFFDRGLRTIDGLMPLVLDLLSKYPDRVIALRGNHETFILDKEGKIRSTVSPSDTLDFWGDYCSQQFWEKYREFFQNMPVIALLKNGTVIVHGGIPDKDFVQGMKTFSDFNNYQDDDLRTRNILHMLWTDPGRSREYKLESLTSFLHGPFGTVQCDEFLSKIGARLVIRGHEEKENGSEFTYPDKLLTVFSAGGRENPDAGGWYEDVTPRFIRMKGKQIKAVRILWELFNRKSADE